MRRLSIKWNLISNGNHRFTWSFGTSCILRSMATKRHQTDNANMAKIARKSRKYGRCQIFAKLWKQTPTKMVISKSFWKLWSYTRHNGNLTNMYKQPWGDLLWKSYFVAKCKHNSCLKISIRLDQAQIRWF